MVDGDVFINIFFGDLWVSENNTMVRINDGQIALEGDKSGFVKIGHIDSIQNLDTEFYTEPLDACPICRSKDVACVIDSTNMLWKIGCSTSDCPCCVNHMNGSFGSRSHAVLKWNNRG